MKEFNFEERFTPRPVEFPKDAVKLDMHIMGTTYEEGFPTQLFLNIDAISPNGDRQMIRNVKYTFCDGNINYGLLKLVWLTLNWFLKAEEFSIVVPEGLNHIDLTIHNLSTYLLLTHQRVAGLNIEQTKRDNIFAQLNKIGFSMSINLGNPQTYHAFYTYVHDTKAEKLNKCSPTLEEMGVKAELHTKQMKQRSKKWKTKYIQV